MKYTDEQLVAFYRAWSEETYSAGFITPHPDSVRAFRSWLEQGTPVRDDIEVAMVAEYRNQEDLQRRELTATVLKRNLIDGGSS